MIFNRKAHQKIRIQNVLFTLLFLVVVGLLAWLSTQHRVQSDWTAGGRNTLSETSQSLLAKLDSPIQITAYVAQNETMRVQISDLVRKYQAHKPDLSLEFVNPDTRPDLARAQNITVEGEMLIRYQERTQQIKTPTEEELSNALLRLTHAEERRVVFITGHGERDPMGQANHDLGIFGQALISKGFRINQLNLIENPSIPENTSALVIADPQTEWLEGERKIVLDYVREGGQLLWLHEPNAMAVLTELSQLLRIDWLPGMIVDATTQTFGINDPSYALVTRYPDHLLTQHLQSMTLFPGSAGLEAQSDTPFQTTEILQTLPRSWTETSPIEGSIQFDADTDERSGPITLGLALEAATSNGANHAQRVAVVGDADFLSNAFLGNGGNLDLGISLIRWLTKDDNFINIPAKTSPDTQLQLTDTATGLIGLGFLFVMPIGFVGMGIWVWFRRRRR